MHQQICQRICSSFLLTLLFSQATTTIPTTSTWNNCHKLMKSAQCQCSTSFGHFDIQCPAMVQDPKIKIMVVPGRVQIVSLTCNHFDDEEYQLLPVMNIGDVYSIIIEDCPLPRISISQLLTHMGIQELNDLEFENHNLTIKITRELLSGLSNMKTLILDVMELSLTREESFMDVQKLEYLKIYSSKISLTPNIFAALVNLKYLFLAAKNLQQLPVGIFRNLNMLESLDLRNTPLRNISKDFFADVTSIKDLHLSSNAIGSLQSDVFSLLTNLTLINLSHSNFRELPSELFALNKELRQVIMTNSLPLKALPSGLFANLPNLYSVYIACDADSMDETDELLLFKETMVRISCDFNEIPHDLFANSSKITKISLTKNKLETLAETLFEHQFLLEYLDLSHNRLQSIPRDLFANLTNLDELYLNNNHIIAIDSDAFINNINLRHIYLENNNINMTDALKYLRKLEILNLRNNTLRHMFKDYVMISLKELDLSHNFITSLDYDDLLQYSNNVIIINLNFNRISKINMSSKMFIGTEQYRSVKLNNNPLDCDCNLLPFLQYVRRGDLSGQSNVHLYFETSELACNKPVRMKNLYLRDVEPKALYCTINFKNFEPPHCPQGCVCWARTYDSVLLVNCSDNNLTKVPALPRVQPLGLESIELHVENNALKELPLAYAPGYEDVTRIYAAANKLSHINLKNLPEHLIYLDLSRNNFKELNENVLNFFIRNSSLKIALSENPWNCDCESKPLMQFLGQSYEMITDFDKVYCSSPKHSNMIEYFNTNDICEHGLIALFTWVVSISMVCFLFAITAALYYKYETEIKIWLYNHNMCSYWVNEEELDKDKTYDAFVSYSSKDEEFVLGKLLPELESGRVRFKLCVHVRDFIVGGIIPDQIIRAIADSRRTIVVLSQNFIKSVWARMEFRLAHQAGLDEKRTKVIAIVYGEIGDISSLDLELQAYLKMTTYLEWGNPWFWERLRYIMPHRKSLNVVNEL